MFELPKLGYDYSALEPHFDAKTMEIHHTKHHQAYITNLNKAIENTDYQDWSLNALLTRINELPSHIKGAIQNHGGGHANHQLFWETIAPNAGGTPQGKLAADINTAFGNFEAFVEAFNTAAQTRFGSGWAWLVVENNTLKVTSTANQDSPLMNGQTPILGLDVWEHAYYLNYQNRRPDYIKAFWNVVNWNKVEALYNEL